MSIEVDEELELVESQVAEGALVRVAQGTGTPFNIKLKPRSVRQAALQIPLYSTLHCYHETRI